MWSHRKIIVVTGTDTEIGKTFISAALARALVTAGVRTVAVKPVESGCTPDRAGQEDGELLAAATGQPMPKRALQRLELPVAPPLAADHQAVPLDPEGWLELIGHLADHHDVVLVEAAGGLMSPLTWEMDALGLARELHAALLVVSADRLGTINHTLMTTRHIERLALPLLGVVMTTPAADRDDASLGHNLETLRRVAPALATCGVPHVAHPDEAQAHMSTPVSWVRAWL